MMKKKKGKLFQRMMAVLLSVILVTGTVWGAVPMEAFAAENEEIPESVSGNETSDAGEEIVLMREAATPAVDDGGCEARYSTDGGNTWTTADTLMEVIRAENATSAETLQIELLRNITLVGTEGGNWASNQQRIGGENKIWTIDGNGHTITRGEGADMLFYINSGSKVTMKDITIDGGAIWSGDDPATRTNSGAFRSGNAHLMYVERGAELVFENGVVLQNSDCRSDNDRIIYGGAAVAVDGKLTIQDGVQIRNNCGRRGGAIWVCENGELIMEGGEIYGNYAILSGGAVYNKNTFQMKGGRIYDNASSNNGGGVCSGEAFCMEGGEVSGNKSGVGGGISVFAGTGKITGGSVTGNAITGTEGGGVWLNSGTLSVSGTPVIKNNTGVNGTVNNVYLNGNAMSVSDSLNAGAVIGVTTLRKPDADTTVAVTGVNGVDYSKYFFSDDEKYQIVNSSDHVVTLALKEAPAVAAPTASPAAGPYEKNQSVTLSTTTEGASIYYTTDGSVPSDTNGICYTGPIAVEGREGESVKRTIKAIAIKDGINSEVFEVVYTINIPAVDSSDADKVSAAREVVEEALADYTATNASTKQDIQSKINAALNDEGITGVTVTVGDISKTEASESEEGSISGSISITCGSVADSVAINKTIPATGNNNPGGGGSSDPGSSDNPGSGSGGQTSGSSDQADTGSSNPTVQTPQTPNNGGIMTDKEQGENTPAVELGTSESDLFNAVLTPEEQSLVTAGANIKINLVINNIDASVREADKQAVAAQAVGYTVGQYLDISLYKIIGDNRTAILQTNGKIRIVIGIPDSLRNTDSQNVRSYAVVRVHDGAAEMLADLDNEEATITIETDLFSTYALVYKDAANAGVQNTGDGDRDSEPKTGDARPVEIYATLAMVGGLSYLSLLFKDGKMGMTEQEKKELTASIIAWGRKGGKLRKRAALAAIFVVLFYYHSIGKRVCVDWKQIYG